MLDAKTFSDSNIIENLNKNFISLKIDADTPYGSKLFDDFKGAGYPLLIFLDEKGNELDRFYGYFEPDQFIQKLNNVAGGIDTFPILLSNYNAGDESVETLSKLALKYVDMGLDSFAVDLYNKVLKSKNLSSLMFHEAKYYLSAYHLENKQSLPLEQYISTYYDSPFLKDAVNQLLDFLMLENLVDKEMKYFEKYIDIFSDDPWFLNKFSWRMTELEKKLEIALIKINAALIIVDNNTQGIANIIDTKAEVLWKLGRIDEAILAIDEAINLDPASQYYQNQKEKFLNSVIN